ncbi:MAG: hypothetical protein HY050_06310 [Actinobacteria bacterium]|nr:hypothetical protein [Actinomycetota bacterium]
MDRIKWVRKFARREGAIYSRYRREHPHITRNLIVDALISVIVVISGFALVNYASANSRLETLRRSGAVTMTAEELRQHVKHEKMGVYWFGPIAGDLYTMVCTRPGEAPISYIAEGSRLRDSFSSSVSVESYIAGPKAESRLHSKAIKDTDSITGPDDFRLAGDENRWIDPSSRLIADVDFPETNQKVEIHYPTLDSSWDSRMSPDKLVLIK